MHRWWYFPSIAVFTLILMSACRLVFFYVNNHELVHAPPVEAMLLGLQFDVSVISYWLAPIFVLLTAADIYGRIHHRWVSILSTSYLILGFLAIMFICVADIGYFKYYYTHIGASVLNWAENSGDVVKMLWGDSFFRWSILGIIGSLLLFSVLHFFLLKRAETVAENSKNKYVLYAIFTVCFFLAMRGGLRARPLDVKDSRYSEHHFFNQVALSPVYSFYYQTVGGKKIMKTMGEEERANFLESRKKNRHLESFVFGIPKFTRSPNVVFILMEGMASHKLKNAPFLDSLCSRSIYFDSFFSTGEHTYNGVFSSLWGEPAVMGKHMLRWMEKAPIQGLPYLLRKRGYRTIFQIPHGRLFDNMGGFLWRHHFDTLTDVSSMPAKFKTKAVWGTSDHLYLEYVIENMNYMTSQGKPVFSTVLTVSDHSPFFLPESWSYAHSKTKAENATLYADWSLRNFFAKASVTEWFKNTLFVLVADHGQFSGKADFALPLALHHIPFLIYGPGFNFNPTKLHRLGSQTDILPTLSGLLELENTGNPIGFDLFKETRPWVVLSSDAYYGMLDGSGYSFTDEFGNFSHFPKGQLPFTGEEQKQRQQQLLQNIWFLEDRAGSLLK
jgi:phosphoglycerol transferase MdoB-like AlkP superfamily enzyme